jgi:hypothetical protein
MWGGPALGLVSSDCHHCLLKASKGEQCLLLPQEVCTGLGVEQLLG